MSAPKLEAMTAVDAGDELLYRVVQSGTLWGRSWQVGELVVCGGTPDDGDALVLSARVGRPRLGVMSEGTLHGDVGEPCSPTRWQVAGRVQRVLLGEAVVWTPPRDLLPPPRELAASQPMGLRRPAARPPVSPAVRRQLSLFGVARAA